MLFLLPCIDDCSAQSNIEPAYFPDDGVDSARVDPPTVTPIHHFRNRKSYKSADDSSDKDILQALADSKHEDTNFALSIVPSLHALNTEEKLDAKISILKVFKDILAQRRHTSYDHLYHQRPRSPTM